MRSTVAEQAFLNEIHREWLQPEGEEMTFCPERIERTQDRLLRKIVGRFNGRSLTYPGVSTTGPGDAHRHTDQLSIANLQQKRFVGRRTNLGVAAGVAGLKGKAVAGSNICPIRTNADSSIQCESVLAHPRNRLHTSGRHRADNPDTGSSDLYSGERPGDPPLRLATLRAQAPNAPAFLALGTKQCEI